MSKHKILISACLLGQTVRYDGKSKSINTPQLEQLLREDRLITCCPEVSGGLTTPRPAAEIQTSRVSQVITHTGINVTSAFIRGAQNALLLCQQHKIQIAILSESSPSCGSSNIYDGSFTNTKIEGEGITTQLLRKHGIKVFSQNQIEQAVTSLNQLSDT